MFLIKKLKMCSLTCPEPGIISIMPKMRNTMNPIPWIQNARWSDFGCSFCFLFVACIGSLDKRGSAFDTIRETVVRRLLCGTVCVENTWKNKNEKMFRINHQWIDLVLI